MKKILALFLAFVIALSLAACGNNKDTTAADTYLSMAQEFLDKGDIDSAIDVLNKGFSETNDPRLSEKLVEIYAQRDSTKETGTSTTRPSATNPPTITFPDRDISAGIQQPTENKNPEPSLTEAQITEKLKESMVKVICYDYDGTTEISHGSGFFINATGAFITSAQVIKDCFYIKIKTHLGKTYDVRAICEYKGATSDYAICNAYGLSGTKSVEFTSTAVTGQTVYAIGCPGNDFALSTTSGKITNAYASEGTKNYYANTAQISHGSRGGVLVDSQGRVLGITTGSLANGEYAALKYQDFKADTGQILYLSISNKTPLEYFHTQDDVLSAPFKLEDNFDIIIDADIISDTQVDYQITLKLKDKYKNDKVFFDMAYSPLLFVLVTEYTYKVTDSTGVSTQTKSDKRQFWFSFDDKNELFSGDTQSATSVIYIQPHIEYCDMEISHSIGSWTCLGSIIIYDKDK